MADVLTAAALIQFEHDLNTRRPPAPTERDVTFNRFPQAVSLSAAVSNASFIARIAMKDGTIADIEMNPVFARTLAGMIIDLGRAAGWLNDDLNIISPPMPRHDA